MLRSRLAYPAIALLLATAAAQPIAAQTIYNDNIPDGTAAFDTTVSANGILTLDTLANLTSGTSWDRGAYTITSTNGDTRFIDSGYLQPGMNSLGNAFGGDAIGIDPQAPAPTSGLTFSFLNPVNAFGLEIGDWATCCFPSSLYISFDGGATRLVATANDDEDNPGYADSFDYLNFVGAIDSTSTFSTVTFYGDGFGEYLVAGGTIRYGTVDIGSVPDNAVPEPTTWAMMLVGFGAIGYSLRRRPTRVLAQAV